MSDRQIIIYEQLNTFHRIADAATLGLHCKTLYTNSEHVIFRYCNHSVKITKRRKTAAAVFSIQSRYCSLMLF